MRYTSILFFFAIFASASHSSERPELELAKADLSDRLQVPTAQISVGSITEKIWTDSSMGCPQPDMAYRDVLINGSQLVLLASGKLYYYHARDGHNYFYCASPKIRLIKKGPMGGPDKLANPEF